MKRNLIFLALALCSCIVCAQPKENGRTPRREKRGFNECIVIDQANIRVLYALNAKDIKDENTYVDLGKLEIGKNVKLRHVPELSFKIDNSIEYGRHMSKIIDSLGIDKYDNNDDSEERSE